MNDQFSLDELTLTIVIVTNFHIVKVRDSSRVGHDSSLKYTTYFDTNLQVQQQQQQHLPNKF
jgi:hypothetical protein